MIRRIKTWALGVAASALLVACGGGGGSAGECVLGCGGTGSSEVADLRIALSSYTLPNGSTDPIDVTITAVNSTNQVVSDASVVVTADNGGVVTAGSDVTDSSGDLQATVGMGDDLTPRTINITATSGNVAKTKAFQVVEGAGGGSAEMVISLSSQTVTATSPATVQVTLRNGSGAVVPNAVVSFTTVRGLGTFSAPSALTNAQGQASVALYPASSSTSGADEVLATASVDGASLSAFIGFQITATNVAIASFTSDVDTVSAYGQTNFNVTLSGVTSGTPVALSINSLCATKNKATFTPTSLTTTNGTATFTYKDNQCGATDAQDTVTVTITGTTTSASLNVALASPSASSIGFVSANPETIYLKGSGFAEESIVTFLVKDQAGNPLPETDVVMEPTTLTGGLTLDEGSGAVTKPSDSNGQVSVRIRSGTVPTPVRVKATLVGTSISTVSSNLSIAVGLPSQLNFSLSQGALNIEGYNLDGTANTYTVIASDRLANPVPAGTTINFVSEGGQVESSRQTSIVNGLGSATAQFQSADPRPGNGRITVLAYALGEESFLDTDGDNVYDSSEIFQDLGDIFLSRRFSDTYEAGPDQYISLALPSGKVCVNAPDAYPGNILAVGATVPSVGASTCDGVWGRAYVRRAAETVLSTSGSRLLWNRNPEAPGKVIGIPGRLEDGVDSNCQNYRLFTDGHDVDYVTNASDTKVSEKKEAAHQDFLAGKFDADPTYLFYELGGSVVYDLAVQGSLSFVVADRNPIRLNPMAAGTTITVSATTGITVSVGGGSPVPSSGSVTNGVVGYKFTDATSGTIFVTTKSPSGFGMTHAIDVYLAGNDPDSATECTK